MDSKKNELFTWFEYIGLSNRQELRDIIDKCPVEEVNPTIIEGYFAEYKKEITPQQLEEKTIKVVSICDLHIPFENTKMISGFLEFCKDEQPDIIVLNGDIVDFYELSSFDKNPQRLFNLQDEIDQCRNFLRKLRFVCKSSKIVYILGNHEDRLRKVLWKDAKSLSSLRSLKFEELLGLDRLKIQLEPVSYTVNGCFKYKHGDIVRQHGSYSAKSEFEKELCSGESGHVHRIGVYCKTTEAGAFGWFEGGCGCELNPEYINGTPNWQNGFTVRYFDGNAFDTHQIFANKGRFRFNGKKY